MDAAAAQAPVAPAPAGTPGRAAARVLFTAVRNEAPFLLEWIAYHKAIGFDRIIVFSNQSDDGTDELLAALAQAGEIEHHPHVVPDGVSPQGNAARLANERGLIGDGDWVLWLDADEFLVVRAGQGRLADLIGALGGKRGVLIPWRLFGDGGNATFPGRFVSEAFCKAARKMFWRNFEIKTLFRAGPGIAGFSEHGIHRPRIDPASGLGAADFLSAKGTTLDPAEPRNRRWLAGEDFWSTNLLAETERGLKLAQINHYSVRTPEHFALKKLRGRGWAAAQAGEANLRHNAEFYGRMNRNDTDDRNILRFEAEVTQAITTLRTHPEVAQADDRAGKLVAERIARLDAAQIESLTALDEDTDTTAAFTLTLPDDAASLVRQLYSDAACILEYGSGGSTMLALQLGVKRLFTVESDPDWAERLRATVAEQYPGRHCEVHHVDIGPTGDWGRPTDPSGFSRYHCYPSEVWDRPDFEHPDVVLVDGRFRVACLVTVMLRCTRPVTVLFDDYADRKEYHWVEGILRPSGSRGRMAVFDVTPTPLPPKHFTAIVGAFSDQR